MIEGWRLLPWFQDAARREPDAFEYLTDCQLCMSANDATIRQTMGCGFESPVEGARPWTPPGGAAGFRGDIEHCAGYTTRLPEVIETARAYAHWNKGQLELFCGKDEPSEDLLDGLIALDGEFNSVQNYWMTPVEEGGGRE